MITTQQDTQAIVTTGPHLQAVTIASSETQCKYRHCSGIIQTVKGHRRREYCDDLCKQAEYRAREDDKERARVEVARIAQETRESEDVQQRYGPGLSEQTVMLLRSILHRYGTAMLHESGTALQRELEPFRTARALDLAQHEKLKAAYHEALLTIAAREDKIEKQRNRIDKQQTQLRDKSAEVEQAQKDMHGLHKLLSKEQEDYHNATYWHKP